jgi:uncharacterized protein (TIGR02996 family)
MGDESALLKAIIAHPDEDTPRLAYADWLDENRPDEVPSPAAGPSSRAEYIRTQCRLATGAFDSPDYPELLEREQDLSDWLATHDPGPEPRLAPLYHHDLFASDEWGNFRRGFHETLWFDAFGDSPEETLEELTDALDVAFRQTPARTLSLEDAMAEEVVLLAGHPAFAQLRGLQLDGLIEGDENEAVAAVAGSPHAAGLRRLSIDMPVGPEGFRALAGSRHLRNLESLVIDYPVSANLVRQLHGVKWFRNLRRLSLWDEGGSLLRTLAEMPPMPRLVSLSLGGVRSPSAASVRRFATSTAFPRLMHLSLRNMRLEPAHFAILARGRWPLRHLDVAQNVVRKPGCEAIAAAPFARTLRVLGLRDCEVTAGGVQALAECRALAGLRHLDLAGNPIGPGGLESLAAGENLRGLRSLNLDGANLARGPIAARHLVEFLSALDTPELRHLVLNNMPVGVRGARVLASSQVFARLTRLELGQAMIGAGGGAALLDSPTLGNLVHLNLAANKVGSAVAKLADPAVFPRLGVCWLGNGIPKKAAARLARRPGIRL